MTWITRLTNTSTYADMLTDVEQLRMPDWPLDDISYQSLNQTWSTARDHLQRITQAQHASVKLLTHDLHSQEVDILSAMVEIDGKFGLLVRRAGFQLTDADADALSKRIQAVKEASDLEATIQIPNVRKALAARFDRLPGDISADMMWKLVSSSSGATWYLEQLNPGANIAPQQAKDLMFLAEPREAREDLIRAERKTISGGGGLLGIGPRMTWLVLVSMLLCTVGIANAMLMSVTERFREIATLKCLGALDGFIMLVFVFEACILGLVGGLIGSLLGLILGGLRMLAVFRGLVFASLPGTELMIAIGIALLSGIILAAGSALYPSYKAARLAPMEAMRVE